MGGGGSKHCCEVLSGGSITSPEKQKPLRPLMNGEVFFALFFNFLF